MPNEPSFLDVDGFRLGYSSEGTGPTAIFIGSGVYYPRTFSQNLRSHLRLVFMDHRGFGKALAPFMTDSFELDQIIDDIEVLRKKLELDKVILVGHSGQGYMALEYAKKHPDNVSHIVLIAMSPDSSPSSFAAADHYFSESACPERKALLAQNLATLEAEMAANPERAFITRMLKFGPMIWYKYDFDASALWKDVEVIPEMFDYVWGKIFREMDVMAGVEKLKMPVFLGLGRYDYWKPPHLWEPVRPKFSDMTVRVFEKSGHTPQLEESRAFDRELLSWLGIKA